MSVDFHRLTVKDVRRETPDAVSIAFEVPDDLAGRFAFRHGQYLTLEAEIGGERLRRSYSICSGLDDGEIRVAVKKVDGGRFSAFANEALKAGATIDVMVPMGRFTVPLDPEAERTYLAVAAGSGITPVLSIVKTVLAREPKSECVLVYGNRTQGDILFREALDDLKDRFLSRLSVHHVLSREHGDVELLNGRIDGDKIAAIAGRAVGIGEIDHAFLCGPWGLVDDVRRRLTAEGLAPERIHAELFTPADGAPATRTTVAAGGAARAEVATAGTVPSAAGAAAEIVLNGRRTPVAVAAGETIVEAAQRAGLDVPYSCKGGMCCTCRAKVVEGAVDMAVNYSLEPWELAAGFVLTCQSRPVGGKVVVDYDAV